jgi:hypothetical protein
MQGLSCCGWLSIVTVFRTAQDATVYKVEAIIDGGQVLPGWRVDLNELFSRLDMPNDRKRPPA